MGGGQIVGFGWSNDEYRHRVVVVVVFFFFFFFSFFFFFFFFSSSSFFMMRANNNVKREILVFVFPFLGEKKSVVSKRQK